jgi:hypothetical protein
MKKIIAVLVALSLVGCATGSAILPVSGTGTSGAASACSGYERSELLWGAVAVGLGVGAGAGGLSTVPVKSEDGKVAVGSISALLGAAAATAAALAQGYSATYKADKCTP